MQYFHLPFLRLYSKLRAMKVSGIIRICFYIFGCKILIWKHLLYMYVYRCEKNNYRRTNYSAIICCLTEKSQIIFCRSKCQNLVYKTNLKSTSEEHVFTRQKNFWNISCLPSGHKTIKGFLRSSIENPFPEVQRLIPFVLLIWSTSQFFKIWSVTGKCQVPK